MAKVQYSPIASFDRSQLVDTLNGIVGQNATDRRYEMQSLKDDRRFQLQLQRQNRQDALQAARNSLADKRYNDTITHRNKLEAEAKQNEADTVQGLLDASTMGLDVPTTEMVDVPDYSKTVDVYDTDKVNSTLGGANLEYGKVDKALTTTEIADLKKYEALSGITDPIEKRREELALAKAGLLPEELVEDNLKTRTGKTWKKGVMGAAEGIADYIADPILNLGRTSEEKIDADEQTTFVKAKIAEKLKINNPLNNYRTRIQELKALQSKNEKIRNKNKENDTLVEKTLSDNKTKKYDGTSKKQEVSLMNRSDYSKASKKVLAAQIRTVMSKKSSTAYKKAALTRLTGDKKEADAIYKADLKDQMTTIASKLERALDKQDKQESIRLKAKLNYLSKKNLEADKQKSPKYQAELQKLRSQKKNLDNKTKNNK